MAGEGIIRMSVKEVKRVGIIQRVVEKSITQVKAGSILGLCVRQIRRIANRYKVGGERGLVHKLRGRPSKRSRKDKDRVLDIYKEKYHDFKPLLASEKLFEIDGIKISNETLRKWLLETGEEYGWQRRKRPHKKWRERKECFGEMVQMDGSRHNWLEGRGPKMTLILNVDDATNETFGGFYGYEGVLPGFKDIYLYIKKYGIPRSIYLDRHSTYKVNNEKQTIKEQLMDEEALTQFGRAMKELGIELIYANSAEAKGRVERKNGVLQDRLVKEMRLANIDTIQEANRFLDGYWPKFNKKFNVIAKSNTDMHRIAPPDCVLKNILCIKEERILKKDSTVRYKNKVYLITSSIDRRVTKVGIEERMDGSVWIKSKGKYLKYKQVEPSVKISEDKIKEGKKTIKWRKYNKSSKPAKDHTWRTYKRSDYHIDITDFTETNSEEVSAELAKMA